ncbi:MULTISPECIES: hypothetical protein [Burkholderia]|uniref:Uncharacterized protein n=1 Tax=Burkholderia contaminans TaxID=488447 RepID=A0A2S5E4Q3_9BURK|nr:MULTISPECIES: hypothetical protein [Burkholderia]EKS9795982.1 hypothetical protein [Burkholderia cepacia]EKS9807189.1 hypothetical protein [Burkholderia cepacia]EKS9810854.1 hypothetical protein [Burkholderia cepacia]EKS9819306.1 hypothetical protein [Burkholderia cepacia]EKS9829767.1 hypothetical protein [Burkholderia cepacia]
MVSLALTTARRTSLGAMRSGAGNRPAAVRGRRDAGARDAPRGERRRAHISVIGKARRDSLSKPEAMQLAIFSISNKIGPNTRHSENSPEHFRDKHAKFFLVYVCAAGFVAFSI